MSQPVNAYPNFIDSFIKFLSRHYVQQIISQIPKVINDMEMIEIQLQFDLNLLHDQEPLIGKWIIEFYPSFYKALQRSVYEVIQRSTQIHYDEFKHLKEVSLDVVHCQPRFINVPIFNTPIHDAIYKTQVLEKSVGSLVHLKNCIIIKANQPELYLASQYYVTNCGCQGKGFLQINHLIHLLRNNYTNRKTSEEKKQCPLCACLLTELRDQRKYLSCQELKVHLNDMAHTNQKKYSNFSNKSQNKQIPLTNDVAIRQSQKNEEAFMIMVGGDEDEYQNHIVKNCKYKLDKGTTFSLFVMGADVGRYMCGQELHVIAYYCFNLANIPEGRFVKVAQEYFIAVQINLVTHLVNRYFFSHFAQVLTAQDKRQPTLSQYSTDRDTKLLELIHKTHKHFQYTKENVLLQFEIWQIIIKISNAHSNHHGLFALKLSLLMSVFWKNKSNISYHYAYNQNKQANIQIQNSQLDVQITNKIDLCLIYEDEDVINEIITRTTEGMEDVYYFPQDADDQTLNQLCMSVIKGGILIVRYNHKMKKQHLDLIRQILNDNSLLFERTSHIKVTCAVWLLVPIMELQQEKKVMKDAMNLSLSGRLSEFRNLFDVVLDMTYVNNKSKQVINDYFLEHSDDVVNRYCGQGDNFMVIGVNQTSQKQRPILQTDVNTTNKKPQLMNYDQAPSVSSCHLVDQGVRINNLNNDQFLKTLQIQNKESLSLLQKYFYKFREEKSVQRGFLNTSYKMAQASALIRYFSYSHINDRNSLYQQMMLQVNEPIMITYADVFVSVLLATETRINSYGSSQALFGSETSNYLFNSHKESYSTFDEHAVEEGQDRRYIEFKKMYSKIINI